MRALGLDIGEKRIGIAMSDREKILASPLATIIRDNDDKAIEAIIELVNKYQIERIVVGLPYTLNGNIGEQARRVIDFIEKLSRYTKANIDTRDERLSTVAAERLLAEAGVKRPRAKSRSDAAAATLILQGYLDSLKGL